MNESGNTGYGKPVFIVNPNAGSRKGERDWPKICRLLKETGLEGECVMTAHRDHAVVLVQELITNGTRTIVVVGGDGTMNEVVNGIFMQDKVSPSEITLGMIPVGTGNDWCRTFHIPFDHKGAVEAILRRRTIRQDVGKVRYFHHSDEKIRYFVNIAGMGFDALVAKKTNLFKEKGTGRGGPLAYFYFIFASLFQFRFPGAIVEVDGEQVFRGDLFSMNVGICKYSGGGMMQVPGAIPDDGLLDVTLIKKTNKVAVLRHTKKLYDGTLVNLPFVSTYQGKSVRVHSTDTIYMEADGESLGHSPFRFEILPQSLNVISGK